VPTGAKKVQQGAEQRLLPSRKREVIPKRLTCYGTGDPHIFPFMGGKFDVHHAGVFSAFKSNDGKIDLQVSFVTCRAKQKWSGGLSVKCTDAIAIKFGAGQVLETSISSLGLKLDGKALTSQKDYDSGESIRPAPLVGGKKTIKHLLDSPQFRLALWTQKLYATFILSLKDRSLFTKAPGLCGGGGIMQYTKVKHQNRAEDNAARIANGGKEIGYPCQKCVAGIGYVGALCSCQEFLVPEGSEIFAKKIANPDWEDEELEQERPAAKESKPLKKYKQKCLVYLLGKPMGALAFQHAALKPAVISAVNDCAEDIAAGEDEEEGEGGKIAWNEESMYELICEQMKALVDKANPSKVLCQLVKKCDMESRSCPLDQR
jgi:hypothetical protein